MTSLASAADAAAAAPGAASQSAGDLEAAPPPPTTNNSGDGGGGDGDGDGAAKAYKRRRISRACDDCRRKKIKCDGKQPCSSCAEFNAECYYQVPSKRNRAARPTSEVEALEARLHAAESIIRKFLPHVDLQSLSSTACSPQQQTFVGDGDAQEDGPSTDAAAAAAAAAAALPTLASSSHERQPAKYLPLVNSQHQLQLTDSGGYDFHGLSSDAAFLSRITQHFPELRHHDSRTQFASPQAPRPGQSSQQPIDQPWQSFLPAGSKNYDFSRLPPRELARMLCDYAFNHATCLLRIVHVPSFYKRFDILYDAEKRNLAQDEAQYLGLLYSVLALGSMYDVDENDASNPDHYAEAIRRGYKFYLGARLHLKDWTECHDLTTLQALLFIIQFLQALGNLNSCYNLIGIALRSALRMGLHRHIDDPRMTPIESETRKRVFHTTRQMDIYLSTTLGLPVVLQSRDVDQPLPMEIDDDDITGSGLHPMQPGVGSSIEAFNAHAKLMNILAMVIECMYPPQATFRRATHVTYMIDFNQVRGVEQSLHMWYQQLPVFLRPGYNDDVYLNRVQILLRFAYAHVQMMLYRPCMLYLNNQGAPNQKPDSRFQALATAGISVCRNIINIGLEIRKQGVLIGPYWFITHTQFFAVLCLIFYVSHNPDDPGFTEILTDAILGRDAISGLNQRSLAADRLSAALESVFDHLPQRLRSEIKRIKGSLKFQLRTPNRTGSSVMAYGSSHSHSSTTADGQRPWDVHVHTGTTISGLMGPSPLPLHNQSPRSSPNMDPSSSHLGGDRSMFTLDETMSYSSALGDDTSHRPLSSGVDTMELIVPDFFDNLGDQQPGQAMGAPQVYGGSSSDATIRGFQAVYPQFTDDPIARMFDDLGSVKL